MFVGGCRFRDSEGTLVNTDTGEEWHLPRAELQVLRLLVTNRGQLVAKQALREGQGEGPVLSEPSVARAVFMLRSFLGPQHEYLIETVKGQGYLLLPQPKSSPQVSTEHSKRLYTIAGSLVGLAFLLLSLWALHRFLFAPPPHTPSASTLLQSYQVQPQFGQMVHLSLYAKSKTNNKLLQQQAQVLAEALRQCRSSRWQHVYVSLSHDGQVLNITMRGMKLGLSEVRNLKISDPRNPKEFVSLSWLDRVGICD
ncbi:helix-turn-helix domain-containing protein [Shewanella submarina]|uniref:Transcriptional regulator n=1 Tax=Shewanella submarina TaxID=2016376 RepID=A0ABV7GDH0_9GAMM|nr:helix-turn-helix domain-containing protein [Shewanella submarina]MCL1037079.1 helix-turn-helix domain-containing protein [Shewanella submarina]